MRKRQEIWAPQVLLAVASPWCAAQIPCFHTHSSTPVQLSPATLDLGDDLHLERLDSLDGFDLDADLEAGAGCGDCTPSAVLGDLLLCEDHLGADAAQELLLPSAGAGWPADACAGAAFSQADSGRGSPAPGGGDSSGAGSAATRQAASPSTSESAPVTLPAQQQPAAHAQAARTAQRAAERSQARAEEERKRQVRMERNRKNAHLSRLRRKKLLDDLQAKAATLQGRNLQLTATVARLSVENAALRKALADAGVPPPALPVLPALVAAAPAAAAPGGAAGALAAAPAGPVPAGGPPAAAGPAARPLLPFLPILLRAAPAAAPPSPAAAAAAPPPAAAPVAAAARQPAAQPAESVAGAAVAAAGGSRKRQRTGAGAAATAFLALFSLFMFAQGPLLAASPKGGAAIAGAPPALAALPEAGGAELRRAGRALQALPPGRGAEVVVQQPPLPTGGGAHLAALLNSTLEALLEAPGSRQAEHKALARLQELAPVALLLDASGDASDGLAVSAEQAFPRLAGQLFAASGLQLPQTCRRVLELDAASLPAGALRSRRSLERHLAGAHGFRGRSLAALGGGGGEQGARGMLPAAGGEVEAERWRQQQQEPQRLLPAAERQQGQAAAGGQEEQGEPADDALHGSLPPGQDGPPTLVSVLLPANASEGAPDGPEGRTLTVVDKVFVVMLEPRRRFVTYSCSLPQAVLV